MQVILVAAPPWRFEATIENLLHRQAWRRLSSLTIHVDHHCQKISIEDVDLTMTNVALVMEFDVHIISTVEKWAIGPKLVISCMDIPQDTQRKNII